MTATTTEIMMAGHGNGAGTGAGTAGGAGAVGAGYSTAGAVIEGTVDGMTTGPTGDGFTVNVPDSPSISTW